ncbi:unnamed protein product, partial [Allacma fusca]
STKNKTSTIELAENNELLLHAPADQKKLPS